VVALVASGAEAVSEVIDCVAEGVGEVTVVVSVEVNVGAAAPAPIRGTRGGARFLIRRLRFVWSRC